jgi:hypothetical protein
VERTPECTKLLAAIIDLYNKACVESDISYYGNFQDYESAKWTLLMRAFDWRFIRIHRKLPTLHVQRDLITEHGTLLAIRM